MIARTSLHCTRPGMLKKSSRPALQTDAARQRMRETARFHFMSAAVTALPRVLEEALIEMNLESVQQVLSCQHRGQQGAFIS